nr:MAG TPA: hypothetical protein [Caudoviricetes sp.]DAZ79796.1 MAG TPA: hypothetical protein [Caudoviricetes sp.]
MLIFTRRVAAVNKNIKRSMKLLTYGAPYDIIYT